MELMEGEPTGLWAALIFIRFISILAPIKVQSHTILRVMQIGIAIIYEVTEYLY